MIVSVFVRRLKDGVTFEEFERAWEADDGYGVPARVINSVSLDDPREVLTIGFVGIPTEAMLDSMEKTRAHDEPRHDRIEEMIESTELKAMYELRTEHDFTADPRAIDIGSDEGLFANVESWGMPKLAGHAIKGGVEQHLRNLHRRLTHGEDA